MLVFFFSKLESCTQLFLDFHRVIIMQMLKHQVLSFVAGFNCRRMVVLWEKNGVIGWRKERALHIATGSYGGKYRPGNTGFYQLSTSQPESSFCLNLPSPLLLQPSWCVSQKGWHFFLHRIQNPCVSLIKTRTHISSTWAQDYLSYSDIIYLIYLIQLL